MCTSYPFPLRGSMKKRKHRVNFHSYKKAGDKETKQNKLLNKQKLKTLDISEMPKYLAENYTKYLDWLDLSD